LKIKSDIGLGVKNAINRGQDDVTREELEGIDEVGTILV
jgi:hypothetical protein